MRLATNILLCFVLSALALLSVAGMVSRPGEPEAESALWVLPVLALVIPVVSFYLLHFRAWSEVTFQWFFWVGQLCLAAACINAWGEYEFAYHWETPRPSELLILQRVLFVFSSLWAGLAFVGVALIQDHLKGLRRRSNQA